MTRCNINMDDNKGYVSILFIIRIYFMKLQRKVAVTRRPAFAALFVAAVGGDGNNNNRFSIKLEQQRENFTCLAIPVPLPFQHKIYCRHLHGCSSAVCMFGRHCMNSSFSSCKAA